MNNLIRFPKKKQYTKYEKFIEFKKKTKNKCLFVHVFESNFIFIFIENNREKFQQNLYNFIQFSKLMYTMNVKQIKHHCDVRINKFWSLNTKSERETNTKKAVNFWLQFSIAKMTI